MQKESARWIPDGIAFNVTSLFLNVPLHEIIDSMLRRIYIDKEIDTSIPKHEIKDLLYIRTQNVHFSINGEIYVQTDGVV